MNRIHIYNEDEEEQEGGSRDFVGNEINFVMLK